MVGAQVERSKSSFHAFAAAEPQRFLVLDATLPVDDLAGRIRGRVSALLA